MGVERVREMGRFSMRCEEVQGRWPDGHEKEWISGCCRAGCDGTKFTYLSHYMLKNPLIKSNTPFMLKLLETSVIKFAYLNKIKVIKCGIFIK